MAKEEEEKRPVHAHTASHHERARSQSLAGWPIASWTERRRPPPRSTVQWVHRVCSHSVYARDYLSLSLFSLPVISVVIPLRSDSTSITVSLSLSLSSFFSKDVYTSRRDIIKIVKIDRFLVRLLKIRAEILDTISQSFRRLFNYVWGSKRAIY